MFLAWLFIVFLYSLGKLVDGILFPGRIDKKWDIGNLGGDALQGGTFVSEHVICFTDMTIIESVDHSTDKILTKSTGH